MRPAYVGAGTFDETAGFPVMKWIDEAKKAQDAAIVWPGSALTTGRLCIPNNEVVLPLEYLGDYNDVFPGIEAYAEDERVAEWGYTEEELFEELAEVFYGNLWTNAYFTSVIYDETQKRAYRVSLSPGGLEFATKATFSSPESVKFNVTPRDRNANRLSIVEAVPSKSVYIGAEIPQKCVWMADKGLAAADLAGYGEETVALAMALDKVPAEVAGGVELAVDSFALDPQTGTATLVWHFTASDGNGESAAVSSLRGGARLLLETASSAGDLGTENASKQEVSLSSATLTIPTSGEAFFARLVLDTP
jgi:hypothetical protein